MRLEEKKALDELKRVLQELEEWPLYKLIPTEGMPV